MYKFTLYRNFSKNDSKNCIPYRFYFIIASLFNVSNKIYIGYSLYRVCAFVCMYVCIACALTNQIINENTVQHLVDETENREKQKQFFVCHKLGA